MMDGGQFDTTRMRFRNSLWVVWMLLPFAGLAQRDTVPHIVSGMFDWAGFKKQVNAPVFQQNDLAIYVLRKDSLGELISQEENSNWIRDWHFIDVNNDRYIDAFYCGSTKAREGYHTYFMRAEAGMAYPVKLSAPGYVHLLKPDKNGLEFILREDAHGKQGYLHRISEYYYFFAEDSLAMGWQLQLVSTTEVPAMGAPRAFVVKLPGQLRTSPRTVDEPPVDYDRNGKPESVGNLIGPLEPGLRGYILAEAETAQGNWSFVVLFDTPGNISLFKPVKGVQMGYAGWMQME
jgi:hypothetical protein